MTKEEEILLAADEEFLNKGYDAASTASIAKAVGVTHAMVNYYYRSKESLFCRILDKHIKSFMSDLKPLMDKDGDFVTILTNVAMTIFDKMNANRRLPFLIFDTSRNHPEFLLRYRDVFTSVCMDSIRGHTKRFEEAMTSGRMKSSAIHDIFDTILTLSCAPFLNLAILTNIAHIPEDRLDAYLSSRRAEIQRLIISRYSI